MAPAQPELLPISDLHPSKKRVGVLARIARAWDYKNKEGEFAHLDIVLIDKEGNKIYGEIPANHAESLKEHLKEGNVCAILDFLTRSSKNVFKAVDGPYMIVLNPWSKVHVQTDVPADFPRYVYSLTDYQLLPALVGTNESFTDVLGIVLAISDLLKSRCQVILKNLLRELSIYQILMGQLWMLHFGETMQLNLMVRTYTRVVSQRPHNTLCGHSHKKLPRLGLQLPSLRWMTAEEDQYTVAFKRSEPETVTVKYLLETDPYEYLGKNMISTITATKLLSNKWWFLACNMCHKGSNGAGANIVCNTPNCKTTGARPRYKIAFMGADKIGEAEFVFFATVAEQLIGKNVDALINTASRRPDVIPAEITTLNSQKYTIGFSVNEKGLQYGKLSFQINTIKEIHGKSTEFKFSKISHPEGSTSKESSSSTSNATPTPGTQHTADESEVTDTTDMENSNPNGSNENSQHSDDTGKESLPADTPATSTPPNIIPGHLLTKRKLSTQKNCSNKSRRSTSEDISSAQSQWIYTPWCLTI